MTLAEINRAMESKKRQREAEERKQASYDYVLADLIGRSISRLYSSAGKMPSLTEAYPNVFNEEEVESQKQAKRMELSAIRFRQFADTYNKRKLGGGKLNDGREISN